METLSRRELIASLGAVALSAAAPISPALANARLGTRERIARLPNFKPYQNPAFGRAEHEALHAEIESEYRFADAPALRRWNADPSRVYVNEGAGESIHITGVNLEQDYAEMIWVLAPAYKDERGERVVAHVPFEHEHLNQDESFERLRGSVVARVNGHILEGANAERFVAQAHDDHIAWNPHAEPLVMRVRYFPSFGQDGERALMVYWGFVDNAARIDAMGRPKSFPLLGALNAHLGPEALGSKMPEFLPRLFSSLLERPVHPQKVAELYRELTGEPHPSLS